MFKKRAKQKSNHANTCGNSPYSCDDRVVADLHCAETLALYVCISHDDIIDPKKTRGIAAANTVFLPYMLASGSVNLVSLIYVYMLCGESFLSHPTMLSYRIDVCTHF